MKLANVKNQEYTKKMFKDIAIFTLAEPGAMWVGNLMEFITAEGEEFSLFFSEEMPYSKVKEYFPALDDCYWNGPESDESCRTEFVFYLSKDERNFKHTKPPKNYTHLYEGFGNHICIRKDYYPVVEPIIRDLIEKNELVNWYKRTEKIINAIKNLTAEKKRKYKMRLEEFLDCFDINCIVEITCENEPVRRCRVSAALSDDRYPAVDYVVLPGSVTFKDDVVHIQVIWKLTWWTFRKCINTYFAEHEENGAV